ncbi:MAG: penicillin-binding transpeptidase domain-containing protein [Clostridia bacterium]
MAVLIATAFIFLILCVRLCYVQIFWGNQLQEKAESQWMRRLPLTAMRGDILDVNGKIIASSKTVYDLYVRPKSVTNPKLTARIISDILSLDYEKVYEKTTKKGVSDITIIKNLEPNYADKIRNANLNGVYLASSTKRMYVDGELLSQVLGFVSADNYGQAGIESYYNKYLTGVNGKIMTPSDLVGVELKDKYIKYLPSIKGCNVSLTIDIEIQTAIESILNIAMKAHTPKKASCIVLDVTNGDIIALSTKPSIDLNNLPRDNIELLQENTRNVLITDIYEPGSTFKVLTASAALEENKKGNPKGFSKNYVFKNNSNFRIVDKGAKIKCWTLHTNGKHCNQNLQMALNNSCNPIFTDIALSLGKETMYKYLKAFGYGSYSGIDFAGEQAGLLISQKNVTNGDLARIGFGQSIAVTALQLANATAAAVNGGYLYQPHIVKSIYDTFGNKVIENIPKLNSQPISTETSKTIALMLQNVVEKGSGKHAFINGYEVGGKTGTAQKFENGKLSVGKYVSSFVGFFPSSSPKYLALVVIDEPVGQNYGSIVAAPYAKLIFEQIIAIKNILPITQI